MKAKEYLRQIELLDCKISQRIRESEKLHSVITGGVIAYDKDKVQSSPRNTVEDRLCRYNDMQNEIEQMIDEMVELRHTIIGEIHDLEAGKNTAVYVKLLYKRYVDCKPLYRVAQELNYDYDWIRTLHGRALVRFESQYLKNE